MTADDYGQRLTRSNQVAAFATEQPEGENFPDNAKQMIKAIMMDACDELSFIVQDLKGSILEPKAI